MKSFAWKNDFIKRIKSLVTIAKQDCLGVYVDEGKINIAGVRRENDLFILHLCEAIEIAPGEDITSELVAEKLKLLCLQKNINSENVSICLSDKSIWWLDMTMPVMSEREIAEAVKWQIEAKDPFNGDRYWYSCEHSDAGRVIAAAISEKDGKELRSHFSEVDYDLKGIITSKGMVWDGSSINSIFQANVNIELSEQLLDHLFTKNEIIAINAAIAVLKPGYAVNALPVKYRLEQIKWKKLSAITVAIFTALVVCFAGSDFLQLKQLQDEVDKLQAALKVAERQENLMNKIQKDYGDLHHKEVILSQLSKQRKTSYALFTHLGTLKHEGVFLREVIAEGTGTVYCTGKAITYNDLVHYLKEINTRSHYFQKEAVLMESKLDDKGLIDFKIQLLISSD